MGSRAQRLYAFPSSSYQSVYGVNVLLVMLTLITCLKWCLPGFLTINLLFSPLYWILIMPIFASLG